MKHSVECLLSGVIVVLLSVSLSASVPISHSQKELSQLTNILHSLNNFGSSQKNSINGNTQSGFLNPRDVTRKNREDFGLFLALGEPIKVDSIPSSSETKDTSMEKRQGNWDFDYGLGGGRFGKRFDYSLGGGRFGRDVDHVDTEDEN